MDSPRALYLGLVDKCIKNVQNIASVNVEEQAIHILWNYIVIPKRSNTAEQSLIMKGPSQNQNTKYTS